MGHIDIVCGVYELYTKVVEFIYYCIQDWNRQNSLFRRFWNVFAGVWCNELVRVSVSSSFFFFYQKRVSGGQHTSCFNLTWLSSLDLRGIDDLK